MTLAPRRTPPPTPHDTALARASGHALALYAQADRPVRVRLTDGEPIELPPAAVSLLLEVLEAMAAGRGVTVVPENAELTTVQAAGILNVSRPYLIKLLEEGAIPHRKVGKHRRVLMEDLMAFKARDDLERRVILDELTREAQEQGYGY